MKRILWDALMLSVFLAVMSFHFVPKMLHEVLGILFPLAVLFHLYRNRRWFATLRQGRWNIIRCLNALVNGLLIVCFLFVTVTGVCLSNHLFKDVVPLFLQRNIALHQLHVSLPFAMLILMGLHLGFHWQSWSQRLEKILPWRKGSLLDRLGKIAMGLAFLGTGIYGSLQNRVGDRLLMKHIFATPATDLPGALYVLLLLGIFALYACIGSWLQTVGLQLGKSSFPKQ